MKWKAGGGSYPNNVRARARNQMEWCEEHGLDPTDNVCARARNQVLHGMRQVDGGNFKARAKCAAHFDAIFVIALVVWPIVFHLSFGNHTVKVSSARMDLPADA